MPRRTLYHRYIETYIAELPTQDPILDRILVPFLEEAGLRAASPHHRASTTAPTASPPRAQSREEKAVGVRWPGIKMCRRRLLTGVAGGVGVPGVLARPAAAPSAEKPMATAGDVGF